MSVNIKNGHPDMDYAEHMRTYQGFLRFTKYGIISLALLLAGMYYFLV